MDGDGNGLAGEGIGAKDGGDEGIPVDAPAHGLLRIHDLVVLHGDGGIDSRRIQVAGKVLYEPVDGIDVVIGGGSGLYTGRDLLHLEHKGVVGDGLIPHQGEGDGHGLVHIHLQLNAHGSVVHGVRRGRRLVLGIFSCGFGRLHGGVHGVVVLLILRGAGGGSGQKVFQSLAGSRVQIGPVGQKKIDDQRFPGKLLLHGGPGLVTGHTAHVHPIDMGAGQHDVADDNGFLLLAMLFFDQIHFRRAHHDVGLGYGGGGRRGRQSALRYGLGQLGGGLIPAQEKTAQTSCQNKNACAGADDPILLLSVQNAHRALLNISLSLYRFSMGKPDLLERLYNKVTNF